MREFEKIFAQQKKKHQGGSKWIGTAGQSMYGNSGYNSKGIRLGGNSINKSAVKVWEKREFKNLDDQISLNTRNIQVALRRLRKFARLGSELEFDLNNTVSSTSKNGGMLDVKFQPKRTNKIRVLLFIDIGGSMDEHAKISEEIFSAAHSEFKSLDFFYFHNCIYESVWKDNRRRSESLKSTDEILRHYKKNTKVIIIGDAAMSPYEIIYPGGSIEHWNEKPGSYWIGKIVDTFNKVIWLNPEKKENWEYSHSTKILKELSKHLMYELNVSGIENGIKELAK
ncbi:MAG: VWA domain-containing protein [Pseudomonadota bacterium]|nr:VWA domain-containing protein [Pseudomonadota bacterium]